MSLQDVASALSSAWKGLHGEEPPDGLVAVLAGQVSIETGGGRGMLNYNFGGIKGTGPSGHSVRFRTTEGYGPTEKKIVDRFRSYGSAQEGATDYVRLLESRFGTAMERARAGDAKGFVHELKKSGYFTGDEKVYSRVVHQVATELGTGGTAPASQSAPAEPSAAPVASQPRLAQAPSAATLAQQPRLAQSASLQDPRIGAGSDTTEHLRWVSEITMMNVTEQIARAAMSIAQAGQKPETDADLAQTIGT
jgi:hypothetical protein